MAIFQLKSILGLIFFAAALGAAFSMLTLMGRQNKKSNPSLLRTLHKINGYIFFLLLLIISYICIQYVGQTGGVLSPRALSHSVLALFLLGLFFIKLLIVRFFKQFLKFAPVLGITVLSLAFVVTATSAGFYFLRAPYGSGSQAEELASKIESLEVSAETGASLFQNKCSFCHQTNSEEALSGPGLKGLLKKEKLPHSGRPATIENVKNQILNPISFMPSFKDLSAQEMADLLAYLEII